MEHFLVNRGKISIHFNMTPEIFFKRCKGLVNGRKYIGSVPNLRVLYRAFIYFFSSSQKKKVLVFLRKRELGNKLGERGEKEKEGREQRRWGGRRWKRHH